MSATTKAVYKAIADVSAEIAALKTCRCCGGTKPVSLFKRDVRYADARSSYCKSCHSDATVAWQKANPDRLNATRRERYARLRDDIRSQRRANYDRAKVRLLNLMRLYRVTAEWYASTLESQAHACAVCKRPASEFSRPLAVDHDHQCCPATPTCGRCNRGLLCASCNTGLHAMERNPGWLDAALSYLGHAR